MNNTVQKILRARWTFAGVYSALAVLILLPLLRPGFVLTLDLNFTPVLRMPDEVTSSYMLHVLFHVLNFFLPGDVIEKLLLFAIFVGAGVGIHRLVRYTWQHEQSIYQEVGAYFGGILYLANPFTYDRLMAGQYNVLLGYALLPFFVRRLWIFLHVPHIRSALWLSAWAAAIGIVSIHTLGLATVIAVLSAAIFAWQRRVHPQYLKAASKWSIAALMLFIIANSYWLVPLALGKGSTAHEIANFTSGDTQAFATIGSSALGKFSNIIRLQGFWAEGRDLYTLPQTRAPMWGMVMLVTWALVVVGAVHLWRTRQRVMVMVMSGSMIAGTIIALGFGDNWLARHISVFAGYREPQKFVGLVALGFALFGAWGATAVLRWFYKQSESQLAVTCIAVLLLFVPAILAAPLWWGASGQLVAHRYPADWTAANKLLNADHDDFQVLFLPWHLYMYYGFAGRIVANPAPQFFDTSTLASTDPEFRGATGASTPTAAQLDRILARAGQGKQLGSQLAPLHIKYILVAHESDFRRYDYLAGQHDLQLIAHGAAMDVYRNTAFGKEK